MEDNLDEIGKLSQQDGGSQDLGNDSDEEIKRRMLGEYEEHNSQVDYGDEDTEK